MNDLSATYRITGLIGGYRPCRPDLVPAVERLVADLRGARYEVDISPDEEMFYEHLRAMVGDAVFPAFYPDRAKPGYFIRLIRDGAVVACIGGVSRAGGSLQRAIQDGSLIYGPDWQGNTPRADLAAVDFHGRAVLIGGFWVEAGLKDRAMLSMIADLAIIAGAAIFAPHHIVTLVKLSKLSGSMVTYRASFMIGTMTLDDPDYAYKGDIGILVETAFDTEKRSERVMRGPTSQGI